MGKALRVLLAVVAVLAVVAGVGFALDRQRDNERRQAAAISFAGSSTAFSAGVVLARAQYELRKCGSDGEARYGGVSVCYSAGLQADENRMRSDCLRCTPPGSPSATCDRVEIALALGEPYDNPCDPVTH